MKDGSVFMGGLVFGFFMGVILILGIQEFTIFRVYQDEFYCHYENLQGICLEYRHKDHPGVVE